MKNKFRIALISLLERDGFEVNIKALESALRKQKLAADNKGSDPWNIETELRNARYFYFEYGKKNTYNRKTSAYRNH